MLDGSDAVLEGLGALDASEVLGATLDGGHGPGVVFRERGGVGASFVEDIVVGNGFGGNAEGDEFGAGDGLASEGEAVGDGGAPLDRKSVV